LHFGQTETNVLETTAISNFRSGKKKMLFGNEREENSLSLAKGTLTEYACRDARNYKNPSVTGFPGPDFNQDLSNKKLFYCIDLVNSTTVLLTSRIYHQIQLTYCLLFFPQSFH
jgi:hypothetical protein